nr:ubiquitin-like-specific protease ESD4 [Ipomoea batatas]
MGALTINRKRGEDYFAVNYRTPVPNFDRVSKKPRLSPSVVRQVPDLGRPVSAKSIVSRLFRYPEVVAPIKREVHAPCRQSRFGFSANSRNSSSSGDFREKSGSEMGNIFGRPSKKEKLRGVERSRYEKEVIEIDCDTRKGDASDDSTVEEIEVVEKARIVSPPKDGHGDVEMLDNFEKNDVGRKFQPTRSSGFAELNDAVMKVESPVRTLDLAPTGGEFDNLGLPFYKKLLNRVQKKHTDDNFKRLNFQIDYLERRRKTYQLLRPQKKSEELIEDVIPEPFVPKEPFIPLTEKEEAEVASAFSHSNRGRVLVTHKNSNIDITGKVLQCLGPGKWLNDEVINVYLELLKEREKREPQKFLKCHFFNTFFYKKLNGSSGYNYQSVRRWTSHRKLGYCLFECDKIFVPIHKEIHWCLAVINKKDEKFQYLDSLRGRDSKVLKVLARYYADEVKDKSGEVIDVSSWEQEFVEDLPEQENGFDCGVFMIKYADFYSRNIGLCFNQEHMQYFRLRTAKEILRLKAE